jgi:hypothetical protein
MTMFTGPTADLIRTGFAAQCRPDGPGLTQMGDRQQLGSAGLEETMSTTIEVAARAGPPRPGDRAADGPM